MAEALGRSRCLRQASTSPACSVGHQQDGRGARLAVLLRGGSRSRRRACDGVVTSTTRQRGRSRQAPCFCYPKIETKVTEAKGSAGERVVDIDTVPLPLTAREMVVQTANSVQEAESLGRRLQVVEWLLPVNQRKVDFLTTDPTVVEPTSTFDEFRVASALASVLLEGPEEREIRSSRLDDGIDSEPVGLLQTDDNQYMAVVFPTADVIDEIRELAEAYSGSTIILVNPQWTMQGNIVSDFGFGVRRKRAEKFLSKFESTYTLVERRIGNNIGPNFVNGVRGVVRLLKTPNVLWQIHIMSNNIGLLRQPSVLRRAYPSYEDLRKLLIAWRRREDERSAGLGGTKSGGEVARPPDTLRDNGGAGSSSGPEPLFFELAEVENMDKRMLTAALMSNGVKVGDRNLEEMRTELIKLMEERKRGEEGRGKKAASCRVCGGSGLVQCPLCVNKGKKYGRYVVDLSCSVCGGHQYVICPACKKL